MEWMSSKNLTSNEHQKCKEGLIFSCAELSWAMYVHSTHENTYSNTTLIVVRGVWKYSMCHQKIYLIKTVRKYFLYNHSKMAAQHWGLLQVKNNLFPHNNKYSLQINLQTKVDNNKLVGTKNLGKSAAVKAVLLNRIDVLLISSMFSSWAKLYLQRSKWKLFLFPRSNWKVRGGEWEGKKESKTLYLNISYLINFLLLLKIVMGMLSAFSLLIFFIC